MQYKAQRPIREIANFLLHQVDKSTRQSHLQILREMADRALLRAYTGNPDLANEYLRVTVALGRKQKELGPVDMVIAPMETN